MELKPEGHQKIIRLIDKGVDIPNPLTLAVGDEVNLDQISGRGVRIYPGCRIYGKETVISEGAQIGYEGPVTIQDCQLGPRVELKGGYFNKAVFLEGACMGLAAQVREGCILEEQANGAHCVGLKQTILFPFVTLGSLINFCDCLMAGGTSRRDHSEVGSSYIHFNFTPSGDKTTASLFGDVPRGVMLNQAPIFLGGQGGAVGPVLLGYGNVVIAGTILRKDTTENNNLVIGKTYNEGIINLMPELYTGLLRMVKNNILYLANLAALEQWYVHVRKRFFDFQEFGDLVYAGVLDKLALARKERTKRLKAMVEKIPASLRKGDRPGPAGVGRLELHRNIEQVCALFGPDTAYEVGIEHRERFLNLFHNHKGNDATYLEAIQDLPGAVSKAGTSWLDLIIHELCTKAAEMLPSMRLFPK